MTKTLAKRHPVEALSATFVRKVTEPGAYCDGNGLYLQVTASGSKSWIVRTVINGRRHEIGVGGLSYTPLADARERAREIRKAARNGGDPLAEKREAAKAAKREKAIPIFETAARTVHAEHAKTFANDKHSDQWIDSLDAYAFPAIGQKRVDAIESADILAVLTPIWLEKPETARRVKQRLEKIFDWAIVAGHRITANPVSGIKEGLPKHKSKAKHFAALPWADVPAFVQSLRSDVGRSGSLAFEFMILCAARTGEVIQATWNEIDIEAKTWTRPAAHMKAKTPHTVPLTPRMLEILTAAKKITDGSDYVFPGLRAGAGLSNMVFHAILKRMKKTGKLTPHGFRSAFRDWAEEKSGHTRHTIETALAHVVKDKVEAAYLRTEALEPRRDLMDKWERFCCATTADVVDIRAKHA